jgi:hypothetical protein
MNDDKPFKDFKEKMLSSGLLIETNELIGRYKEPMCTITINTDIFFKGELKRKQVN